MQQILLELQTIRRKSRWMLITQRVSLILAALLLGILLAVLFDFAVRLPSAFRFVLLLAGLIALAVAVWRYFLSVLDFSPTLTQIALRAEHVLPAVTGRLASGVEFASVGMTDTNALAARAVRDLQDRLAGSSLNAVLKKSTTRRDLALFCAIAAIALLLAVWKPAEASIGLTRLFVPFSSEQWPARTGVDSQMYQVLVHSNAFPRGSALPLRARVTKGPNDQPVEAHFRFKKNDRLEDWQTAELTWQGPTVLGGSVHERLIDTSAQAIELYFSTADARTDTESITLVPPPAIQRATVNIAPPQYASNIASLQAELGPGTDKRSITETPMLVGSSALLTLTLNKPVNPPQDQDPETWLRQTLSWPADQPAPKFIPQEDGAVWTLAWPFTQTANLNIHLFDEYGLSNSEPVSYRIAAIEDHDPAVVITQPQADQPVTAAALLQLTSQATDDVGLTRLGFTADVQRKSAASQPAASSNNPDSSHEWSDQTALEHSAESSIFDSKIDLKPLNLVEGDVVEVTAFAEDVFSLNDAPHHVAQSPPRRLRIISDVDMATQLRRQFSIIRQNAIRIEAVQAELQDEVADESIKPGVDRAQAQISERIAAQRQSIEDVQQALDENRINDDQLNELVNQARDIAEHAGRAATRATDLIQSRAGENAAPQSGNPQNSAASSDRNQPKPSADNKPESKNPDSQNANPKNPNAQGSNSQNGKSAQQNSSNSANQNPSSQTPSQQNPSGQQSSQQSPQNQQSSPSQQSPAAQQPQKQEGNNSSPHANEPRPEDKPITEAQQEVRDELADLIQLLDRDEDTWVVSHQLENLIQEQQRLQVQTQKAGERTVGQQPEDLADKDRSELDRIARKQDELRESARESVEQMRSRADALQQIDPQSSQAMRNAAQAADQQQLDQLMQKAAQQVQQNQMQSATGSQQQSTETLQRMLQALQDTRQARTQELLRKLESLIESIQRLVTIQENQLVALAKSEESKDFSDLDRALIRLNQNTLAVSDEARTAGSTTRRVARTLERAADAQGSTVTTLRANPINAEDVRTGENRSLELLNEALAQAKEVQKKTEDENTRKQREDLKDQYRKFAEQQVALREQTIAIGPAGELDRRQLVDARRISADEETLRKGLADLRSTTAEITAAPVFSHAHDLIDRWTAAVRDDLQQGSVDITVTDRQQLIADAIGRLISAVEESISPPDEFAKNENNGSGGQNGEGQQGAQPLIPPVAEIKLLHGLQEQIYLRTRDLDARENITDQDRYIILHELAQQQRELHDLGQDVLDRLQKEGSGGGRPGSDAPNEGDSADKPKDIPPQFPPASSAPTGVAKP